MKEEFKQNCYQKAAECIENAKTESVKAVADEYYLGKYLPRNLDRAISLLQPLADSHDPQIEYDLSRILVKRNGQGDMEEAVKLLTSAAEKDHGKASYYLYRYYFETEDSDKEKAFRYLVKAADQFVPAAMYDYGIMLYYGDGFDINRDQAVTLWEKAAELGDINSQKRLKISRSRKERTTRPPLKRSASAEKVPFFPNGEDKKALEACRECALLKTEVGDFERWFCRDTEGIVYVYISIEELKSLSFMTDGDFSITILDSTAYMKNGSPVGEVESSFTDMIESIKMNLHKKNVSLFVKANVTVKDGEIIRAGLGKVTEVG